MAPGDADRRRIERLKQHHEAEELQEELPPHQFVAKNTFYTIVGDEQIPLDRTDMRHRTKTVPPASPPYRGRNTKNDQRWSSIVVHH